MLTYGPQGKVWWWAKKGQKGLNGQQALVQINDGAYPSRQNFGWSQMGPINQFAVWRHGIVAAPVSSAGGLENWLYLETKRNYAGHQPRYVYPAAVWVPPAQAEQYGLMQTNIDSFVSQWTAQYITGTKDLNKDWAAYVQGVQNLGLSQYLQTAQRAMGTPFDTSSFTASNM